MINKIIELSGEDKRFPKDLVRISIGKKNVNIFVSVDGAGNDFVIQKEKLFNALI